MAASTEMISSTGAKATTPSHQDGFDSVDDASSTQSGELSVPLPLPSATSDGSSSLRGRANDFLSAVEHWIQSSGGPARCLCDPSPAALTALRAVRCELTEPIKPIDDADSDVSRRLADRDSFPTSEPILLMDFRGLMLRDNVDAYSDEDVLEILGTLAEPHEPPPHFPVGPWTCSECQICFEWRWLYRRACCSFPACGECLTDYFTSKVKEGVVHIECCNPSCNAFVHRDEVSARLQPHMKERFRLLLLKANANPRSKTCPRCNQILTLAANVNLKNTKNHPERSRVQCSECKMIWCFSCHSPWHYGFSCKQFRTGDKLLKSWAEEIHHGQRNAQRCPKCQIFIQRTSGCDHMYCAQCKTNFCYRCGDQLRKLRFFGDHYSKLSVFGCKYRYKANQPVQRKFIRGAVFGGKLLIAPIVGTLGACAGVVAMGLGIFALPVYGGIKLYRQYEAKHRPIMTRLPLTGFRTRALYESPTECMMPSSFCE